MSQLAFTPSGFSSRRSVSPGALTAAIAVHVGVAGLLIALPADTLVKTIFPTFPTRNIPFEPTKPEARPERKPVVATRHETVTTTKRPDEAPAIDPIIPITGDLGGTITPIDTGDSGGIVIQPDPVLVEARPDPRYADALQPPYPPAMLRLAKEGSVTLRITIDERGRVVAATEVASADPAFTEAAVRQALRSWRFRPATRDGVAVRSERTMTVHFRIRN